MDKITAGHWVILETFERKRVIKCTENTVIDLKKLGKFNTNDIIGQPLGCAFQILEDGQATATDPREFNLDDLSTFESSEIKEIEENNQDIFDDGSAQSLTSQDIEQLKTSLQGKELIEAIVSGSKSFEKRTIFSKEKYLKRKKKKFMKIFRIHQVTPVSLCEFYFSDQPSKSMDLRIDSLSQILLYSNICSGGNYLIFDGANGLITASVLYRLAGKGHITCVYSNGIAAVEKMNINTSNVIRFIQYDKIQPKIELKNQIRRDVKFDAMIVADNLEPLDLLNLSSNDGGIVKSSGQIVMYSQYKEILATAFEFCMKSNSFCNISLSEPWLRRYQVLPGRFHPEMRTSSSGGFLLTAVQVAVALEKSEK